MIFIKNFLTSKLLFCCIDSTILNFNQVFEIKIIIDEWLNGEITDEDRENMLMVIIKKNN